MRVLISAAAASRNLTRFRRQRRPEDTEVNKTVHRFHENRALDHCSATANPSRIFLVWDEVQYREHQHCHRRVEVD
jgi:hypothetical protein